MCRKSTSPVATNLYTFRNERSDELGGMAVHTNKKIIMKYLEELLTFVALVAWFTYGYLVLIAVV